MKNVMIIPAKGNSVRIPGKNLKLFCGLPLFLWSVIQGVASKSTDEVWVSTDSDEIEALALEHGARVFRRKYVDKEHTPGYVPVYEWVLWAEDTGVLKPEYSMNTRLCTTPHLLPDDLDKAITMFWYNKGVYGAHNLGGAAMARTHVCSRVAIPGISMQIPEATCHNNYGIAHHLAFTGIVLASEMIKWAKNLENENPDERHNEPHKTSYWYPYHEWQMQDVDTEEEWEFAELVMEHYILKGRSPEEVYNVK